MRTALTSRAIAAPSRGAKAHRRRRMRRRDDARASSSAAPATTTPPIDRRRRRDRGTTGASRAAPRSRGTRSHPRLSPSSPRRLPSAHAKLDIIYDGELQTAYTFPVQLQVIALRGSVASQWEGEFNKTMLGKGKASVTTAASPGEMFDELLRTAPPPSFPGGYISPADYIAGKRPPPGAPPPPPPPSNKDKKESKGSPKYLKADVVSVGDEFLAAAVTRGLVLPGSVRGSKRVVRAAAVRVEELATRDLEDRVPVRAGAPRAARSIPKHHRRVHERRRPNRGGRAPGDVRRAVPVGVHADRVQEG